MKIRKALKAALGTYNDYDNKLRWFCSWLDSTYAA